MKISRTLATVLGAGFVAASVIIAVPVFAQQNQLGAQAGPGNGPVQLADGGGYRHHGQEYHHGRGGPGWHHDDDDHQRGYGRHHDDDDRPAWRRGDKDGRGVMGRGGRGGFGMGFGPRLSDQPLSAEQVKEIMEGRLAWHGNDNLKLGEVTEKDDKTVTVQILTKDGSLVRSLEIDRTSGRPNFR